MIVKRWSEDPHLRADEGQKIMFVTMFLIGPVRQTYVHQYPSTLTEQFRNYVDSPKIKYR